MAGMLLSEMAKQLNDGVQKAVIETFAEQPLLGVIPFEDVVGGGRRYNQEQSLPGIAFRNINGSYTPSNGVLNPVFDPLKIGGGEIDVDQAAVQMGLDRAVQEAMKLKALRKRLAKVWIKGDSQTTAAEIDGLQVRIPSGSTQLVAAGGTANGDALSLFKLDSLIAAVDDPTHLLMSKAEMARLNAAAHTPAVGGYITVTPDQFGFPVVRYQGLPIIEVGRDDTDTEILAFNEACPGGGTDTGTSIYCVSFCDGMLTGIQSQAPQVDDFGIISASPVYRTRIEWLVGMSVMHPRSIGRLYGISNAPVVV